MCVMCSTSVPTLFQYFFYDHIPTFLYIFHEMFFITCIYIRLIIKRYLPRCLAWNFQFKLTCPFCCLFEFSVWGVYRHTCILCYCKTVSKVFSNLIENGEKCRVYTKPGDYKTTTQQRSHTHTNKQTYNYILTNTQHTHTHTMMCVT